jgi:hypothetical protein
MPMTLPEIKRHQSRFGQQTLAGTSLQESKLGHLENDL